MRDTPTSIDRLLAARALPALLDGDERPMVRERIVELFATHVFGASPPPVPVRAEVIEREDDGWGGKASVHRTRLLLDLPDGVAELPVVLVLPRADGPVGVVVALTFDPYPCGEDVPIEEVLDQGWGLAVVPYGAAAPDDDSPAAGLAAARSTLAPGPTWGRIGTWAWAASRVLDHLLTLPEVDPARIAVAGHSRLGKSALWAAAQDERFAAAVVNNSGSTGAALSRGKTGERIAQITHSFPFWFTPGYAGWAEREEQAPFDQHLLLAAVAPRPLYVSSAVEDTWADPLGELLGCAAASPAWESRGLPGLVHDGAPPAVGDVLHGGTLGYHLRSGGHFHGRLDWRLALTFLDRRLSPSSPASG